MNHDSTMAGIPIQPKSTLQSFSMIGGGKKENRKENDFYPTPPNVTHALMKFLHSECDFIFDHALKIHEPACGSGEMSEAIKSYGHDVYSSDINTEYGEVANFLDPSENLWFGFDAIITNPPFNLSEPFINKALNEARIVCMLLKSHYWHAKKRFELFERNTPKFILLLTWRPDFDGRGAPTMDLLWTVWIKGYGEGCKYKPLTK